MNEPIDEMTLHRSWWSAIRDNDLVSAQKLLDEGFDIETMNSRSETAFLFCAGNGMQEQARWLLARGANPNASDLTGSTALHLAIRRNAWKEIEGLVSMGVAIDGRDGRGTTPLLLASTSEHWAYELGSELLRLGANPNIAANSSSTPLLVSAASKDLRLMDALLDAGADHLAVGVRGNLLHSLLESEAKNAEEVAIRIIDRFPDLDVNQLSRGGSTPLAFAVSRGARDVLKALMKAGADPNALAASKLGNRMSALMLLSCGPCDEEAYQLAFSMGADAELRDEGGFSALAYALYSGATEEEEKTLDEAIKGKNLNQKELKKAVSGFLWARRQKNVEALLAGGASPTAPLTGDGRSAYHAALSMSDKEDRIAAIRWLADRGFAVSPGRASLRFPVPQENWAQDVGSVAMVNFRDEDTIEALLDAGLDPKRPDENGGLTLLHTLAKVSFSAKENDAIAMAQRQIAVKNSNPEKEKESIEHLQGQVSQLIETVDTWRTQMFNRLVEITGTADAPDKTGLTPLGYFVANGLNKLAEAALAAGADPMHCDEDGDHVIGVAIKSGNVEWLHRLVEKVGPQSPDLSALFLDMTYSSPESGPRGGFVNALRSLQEVDGGASHWLQARDENGNTPLIVAAATMQEDLVDSFLAMGADPNVQANDGNTALHHAIMEGRGDIVKVLLAAGADKALRNKAGKDAMDVARMRAVPYIVRTLQDDIGEKPSFTLDENTVEAAKRGREKARESAIASLPPKRMAM